MSYTGKYTTKQFIDAIPGTGGIVTAIANRVGCTWHTAKKYIDGHPTVKKAYDDECEAILDLCESTLIKSIQKGETADAKWYLARKGRHRGYVERKEITGDEGDAINVVVRYADPDA